MPPILVPSATKHIATQMLVIAKSNGRKDFIWRGFLCDIIRPTRNYLFKVSYWNTRIRFENCFGLRMNTMAPLLTVNIFRTCSNCWLWTGKRLPGSYWKNKHFWRQDRVYQALCCSILKLITKWHLNVYLHNPTGESVRNFCERVYFRLWFWLKRCGSHSKWLAVHLSF